MVKKIISSELAEILGLLCAEGSYINTCSSYWGEDRGKPRYYKNQKSERIEFCNKSRTLLLHFRKLLLKEFKYKTKLTSNYKINICKRTIIKEILSNTKLGHTRWSVPISMLSANNKRKISFIRGFFDGDGTASNSIRFFSTNESGLNQIFILLKTLNFEPYFETPMLKQNRKPLFVLRIRAKERETFLNLIKPTVKLPGYMRR